MSESTTTRVIQLENWRLLSETFFQLKNKKDTKKIIVGRPLMVFSTLVVLHGLTEKLKHCSQLLSLFSGQICFMYVMYII